MVEEESHPDDMLSEDEEEILKQIEKWMDNDIEAMIKDGCNVSCATLLSIFMEVLGGIAGGLLMEENKERARFQDFLTLRWVPREYSILDNKLYRKSKSEGRKKEGLYERYRCNLVHTYFFGGLKIANIPEKTISRCLPDDILGIQEANDGSGQLILCTNALAYDIKKVRDYLFQKIREGNNEYRKNFRKVLANIRSYFETI